MSVNNIFDITFVMRCCALRFTPILAGGLGMLNKVGFACGFRRFFTGFENITSSKCSAKILQFFKNIVHLFSRGLHG